MKKLIIIIAVSLGFSFSSGAQSFDEWFNQRVTQKRYLLAQIVALKVQITHIRKTYKIAKEGLDFISKATKGEFDLHNDYFNSLKKINPEVSGYPLVKEITGLQVAIARGQQTCRRLLNETGSLSSDEIAYVESVFQRIEKDSRQILDELKLVVTANKLEMRDDERLGRINELHTRMQQVFLINQQFSNGALQLAKARKSEKDELENIRILNGIKR